MKQSSLSKQHEILKDIRYLPNQNILEMLVHYVRQDQSPLSLEASRVFEDFKVYIPFVQANIEYLISVLNDKEYSHQSMTLYVSIIRLVNEQPNISRETGTRILAALIEKANYLEEHHNTLESDSFKHINSDTDRTITYNFPKGGLEISRAVGELCKFGWNRSNALLSAFGQGSGIFKKTVKQFDKKGVCIAQLKKSNGINPRVSP